MRQTRTFRKIEQEIKERNRRSKKRLKEDKKSKLYNDEFYVDKSRQIATMTAEKDLKGHILKHRSAHQLNFFPVCFLWKNFMDLPGGVAYVPLAVRQ